ncbi:DMT family transporter [Streptomyces sp. NPDC048290]|uniref:DMT family transporter n=1 Tax=Streptomyces sp. NPDC048290 TaxID=3155811 RepID=UPI003414147D
MAVLALVAVTAVWGSTFLVIQDSTQRMPALDFVAARFLIGALVLAALRPRAVISLDRAGWSRGAALGLALGGACILQALGLQRTSATVSAFVSGTFVVFTPFLSVLVLRRKVTPVTWAGTALATAGLALLSLRGLTLGIGETLTLGCALCITLQLLGTDLWADGRDACGLALAQMVTVALVAATASAAFSPHGLTLVPPDRSAWFGVLWTAVLATAAALVLQTWAQTRLSAARAGLIMTLEPVFAALFGLLAGHHLSTRHAFGCALVLIAMVVVEYRSGRRSRGRHRRQG